MRSALLAVALLAIAFSTGADQMRCTPVPTGPTCTEVDPNGYGACEMILGYAFDGQQCTLVSGCGCEPDCNAFFDTEQACREACDLPVGPVCRALTDGDYGVCARFLGYAFNGRDCVGMSGCGCEPDCDAFFETRHACRAACDLGGQEGSVCQADTDCAADLRCCYPCGIAGCDNVCTQPCDSNEMWCSDGCPMYP